MGNSASVSFIHWSLGPGVNPSIRQILHIGLTRVCTQCDVSLKDLLDLSAFSSGPGDEKGREEGIFPRKLIQLKTRLWCIPVLWLYRFLFNQDAVGRVVLMHAAAAAKLLQSCPTVWPHRRQPTRLLRPWGFPGKRTGVGCHHLLQGSLLGTGR